MLAAGLPSLATHAGASNRPHLTLAAGDHLADPSELREGLTLPVAFSFGGVMLFPVAKGRFVLARAVVVTAELLALHSRVHATQTDTVAQTAPSEWSPHVTLGMRLTAEQVGVALPLLGVVSSGAFVGARLWDGVEKTVGRLDRPRANPPHV